jgi:hypothetical protein
MIAASAMPTPSTSVSMCAASEIRASEDVANPTANSTTMKTAPMPNAIHSLPACCPLADADPCPCP